MFYIGMKVRNKLYRTLALCSICLITNLVFGHRLSEEIVDSSIKAFNNKQPQPREKRKLNIQGRSYMFDLKLLLHKGKNAYENGQPFESGKYYKQALNASLVIGDYNYLVESYSGIGSVFLSINDLENAELFTRIALDISKKKSLRNHEAKENYNIGNIKMVQGEIDSAISYYNYSEKLYSLEGSEADLARLYLMKGYAYFSQDKILEAERNVLKSLKISESNGDFISVQSCKYMLGLISFTINKVEESKKYLTDAKSLTKRVNNFQIHSDILVLLASVYEEQDSIEVSNNLLHEVTYYRDSLESLSNVLRVQKLAQNDKVSFSFKSKMSNSYMVLMLCVSIFLLVLSSYIIWKWRKTVIERTILKDKLKKKDRDLLTKSMMINQQKELLLNVESELESLNNKEENEIIFSLLSNIKSNDSKNMWLEFEKYFNNSHPNFYSKLNSKYPSLTPNERRLSSLICLNLNNKEIAQITNKSVRSIEVARYRLRKKMGIEKGHKLISKLSESI